MKNVPRSANPGSSTVPTMDCVTKAVLESVHQMGYVVRVDDSGPGRVAISAGDMSTSALFVVRSDDLYDAACALAERAGIELDDN